MARRRAPPQPREDKGEVVFPQPRSRGAGAVEPCSCGSGPCLPERIMGNGPRVLSEREPRRVTMVVESIDMCIED